MINNSIFSEIPMEKKYFNNLKKDDIVNYNKWSKNIFYFETCYIAVFNNRNKQVVVEGIIREPLRSKLLSYGKQIYVQYWASSPYDSRHSFLGSGLPFPNEEIAYSNSPNIGRVALSKDGSFSIKLLYPNSYYKKMGSVHVKPNVKILFNDKNGNMYGKIITINIGNGVKYNSLQLSKNNI